MHINRHTIFYRSKMTMQLGFLSYHQNLLRAIMKGGTSWPYSSNGCFNYVAVQLVEMRKGSKAQDFQMMHTTDIKLLSRGLGRQILPDNEFGEAVLPTKVRRQSFLIDADSTHPIAQEAARIRLFALVAMGKLTSIYMCMYSMREYLCTFQVYSNFPLPGHVIDLKF